MRCQSSLGVRCAQVSVDHWVSQVRKRLHAGVISRHIILTVPAMFRTTVYPNAAVVLSALRRCGAQCLDDVSRAGRGQALRGGSSTVRHTHGRNGQYHPHLHLLAPSGGYDEAGDRGEHVHDRPSALRRRQWPWYWLSLVRQTLKTEAIHPLVEMCFKQYPHGLVTNVHKGNVPSP
jgi:hypothetical protein